MAMTGQMVKYPLGVRPRPMALAGPMGRRKVREMKRCSGTVDRFPGSRFPWHWKWRGNLLHARPKRDAKVENIYSRLYVVTTGLILAPVKQK